MKGTPTNFLLCSVAAKDDMGGICPTPVRTFACFLPRLSGSVLFIGGQESRGRCGVTGGCDMTGGCGVTGLGGGRAECGLVAYRPLGTHFFGLGRCAPLARLVLLSPLSITTISEPPMSEDSRRSDIMSMRAVSAIAGERSTPPAAGRPRWCSVDCRAPSAKLVSMK